MNTKSIISREPQRKMFKKIHQSFGTLAENKIQTFQTPNTFGWLNNKVIIIMLTKCKVGRKNKKKKNTDINNYFVLCDSLSRPSGKPDVPIAVVTLLLFFFLFEPYFFKHSVYCLTKKLWHNFFFFLNFLEWFRMVSSGNTQVYEIQIAIKVHS